MTPYLFVLLWYAIEYDCPWGLGKSPASIKAIACTQKQEQKYHLDETLRGALDKAEELGPGVPITIVNLQTGKPQKFKWEAHGN